MGIYRAAFATIEQTEPLARGNKIKVPVVSLGGEKGMGSKVGEMVSMVAETVDQKVLPNCGRFIPEEYPDEIMQQIVAMTHKFSTQ